MAARAGKAKAPPDDAHEATSEQARVSAINALIDRGYGNLKAASDGDDAAHGITVRFVAPAEGS